MYYYMLGMMITLGAAVSHYLLVAFGISKSIALGVA